MCNQDNIFKLKTCQNKVSRGFSLDGSYDFTFVDLFAGMRIDFKQKGEGL